MLIIIVIAYVTYLCLTSLREPIIIDFVPMVVFTLSTILTSFIFKSILQKRILKYYEATRVQEDEKDLAMALSTLNYILVGLYGIVAGSMVCMLIKYLELDNVLIIKLIIPVILIVIIEILIFITCFNTMKKSVLHTILLIWLQEAWIINKGLGLIIIFIGVIAGFEFVIFGAVLALSGLFGKTEK